MKTFFLLVMADNTSSSKGKAVEGGGGKGGAEPKLARGKPKKQTNNKGPNVKRKSEERKTLSPITVYQKEATLIYDFQSATQEDIDIVAVSVLKKISIKQAHELRRKNPKVFNCWYRNFWFWTGNNFMRKPPMPPNGWFQKCVLTQPCMKDGEWRPPNWFDRFATCPFAGRQWKPIVRVLPSLYDITEKNKNVVI